LQLRSIYSETHPPSRPMASQHPTLTDAVHRPSFHSNDIRRFEWRTLRFPRTNITVCLHEHTCCDKRGDRDRRSCCSKNFSLRTTRNHLQLASQRLSSFYATGGLRGCTLEVTSAPCSTVTDNIV